MERMFRWLEGRMNSLNLKSINSQTLDKVLDSKEILIILRLAMFCKTKVRVTYTILAPKA